MFRFIVELMSFAFFCGCALQANPIPPFDELFAKDQEVMAQYQQGQPWGLSIAIDLHGCDPFLIRDENSIRTFLVELVDFLDMKRFGDPVIQNFGADPRVAGYSAIQLIETSCVTAHFANETNSAFIDIFSCKSYAPYAAALFCKKFFKADEIFVPQVTMRNNPIKSLEPKCDEEIGLNRQQAP